jgi:hypothetical protein
VLHVLEASGGTPSMTNTIQSDGADTWGSPADQIVFDEVTDDPATHWQRKEIPAGVAITDTWWRDSRVIASGTFTYRIFFSIQ